GRIRGSQARRAGQRYFFSNTLFAERTATSATTSMRETLARWRTIASRKVLRRLVLITCVPQIQVLASHSPQSLEEFVLSLSRASTREFHSGAKPRAGSRALAFERRCCFSPKTSCCFAEYVQCC